MTDTLEDTDNPEEGVEVESDVETEWLNATEIAAKGAWRESPEHKLYWLDLDQLTEFERTNASIDTDEEFWSWFGDFARKAGLKPTAKDEAKERKDRGKVSGGGGGGNWAWGWRKDETKYSSGGYLRDMWSSWGYSHASSDLTRKLAVALGAVNTTVQAIRTKPGRYQVKLAEADGLGNPVNYTSFDDNLIVVSPQPLKDPMLDEQRGIEIETGWALHEAGHTEYTVDVFGEVLKPYVLRPAALAGMICNILEDVRIERLVGENFPGFAPYFDWSLEYLWAVTGRDDVGAPVTRDAHFAGRKLNQKINWVIRTIRWPKEFEPLVKAVVDDGSEPKALEEFDWWRGWLAEYDEGRVSMRESIVEALARLAADPDTQNEMQQQTKAEEEQERQANMPLGGSGDHAAREMLRRLIEQMRKDGKIIAACPSPAGSRFSPGTKQNKPDPTKTVTQAEGAEIGKLIAEELQIEIPPPRYADQWGGPIPSTNVTKPQETPQSKTLWNALNRVDPLMQRLRAAFVFRPAAAEYSNRLLKNGSIDDEELYRWKIGDYRVFEQRVIESKPDTDITILIDQSGSMSGTKLKTAVRLCRLMQAILRTTNGTSLRVRSHTNGVDGDWSTALYRIWEPGDPDSRLALPETMMHGANNDGWALGWCIDELLRIGKPNNQKVLFILSDGIPAGQGYSGVPAMDHVRRVTEWGEKHGVTTIQIAVGVYSEDDQRRMYRNYVLYENDESLPGKLTKIMAKIL